MMRFAAALLLVWVVMLPVAAQAQETIVVAIVNDKPVTGYDVIQRATLLKVMGDPRKLSSKQLANDVIDDLVKLDEATKLKINATDKDVNDRLSEIAKNMKTTLPELRAKLNAQGVSNEAINLLFAAQISFGRLIQMKYHVQIGVTDAEVDKKLEDIKAEINGKVSKIESDPNRQPIKVYNIIEIELPVDTPDPQLLQSRAVESQQIISKFKGCSSAKSAATGIFNVKIGKQIEADGRKLPTPLKAAFDKAGPGRAIGPVRSKNGLQVLGFCGTRVVMPPKLNVTMPTREQARSMAFSEKFEQNKIKYSAMLRKTAVIEYKDPSYAQ